MWHTQFYITILFIDTAVFLVIFTAYMFKILLYPHAVKKEFKRFRVKYGAYVAIDADTGKVLAAVSSIDYPDLTFKRTFPAASTFKIVTAAAALETGLATPNTEMVCGGTGDSCSPSVWLNSRYKVKGGLPSPLPLLPIHSLVTWEDSLEKRLS
jgi:cell division protein FtsI/penicillin-binding protein 2